MNVELNFEKRYRLVREVIETIVLTLLMFLVINLAVQNFDVDGHSMEPNLHDQERLMVDKWTYMFHAPARGDIVVFVAPPQPTLDYVKRIIGVPGDTITIRGTTVIVDGVTLNETYIRSGNQGNPFADKHIENMVVPPDDFFVLGDNRANSSDSRDWGFLPRKNVIGRAMLIASLMPVQCYSVLCLCWLLGYVQNAAKGPIIEDTRTQLLNKTRFNS